MYGVCTASLLIISQQTCSATQPACDLELQFKSYPFGIDLSCNSVSREVPTQPLWNWWFPLIVSAHLYPMGKGFVTHIFASSHLPPFGWWFRYAMCMLWVPTFALWAQVSPHTSCECPPTTLWVVALSRNVFWCKCPPPPFG